MAKVEDCPGFETFGADVKAEPFKLWLAQVGRERIEETIDPEQAIDRALETYQKKGYDTDWIHQRLLSIRVRNELTAEWQERGVQQGKEYVKQKETVLALILFGLLCRQDGLPTSWFPMRHSENPGQRIKRYALANIRFVKLY